MLSEDEVVSSDSGIWGKTLASRQRRQQMIVAAKSVFLEEGYQRASVDSIAAAAGATKRTLYDHFGNKASLFQECILYCCDEFLEWIPEVDMLPRDTEEGLNHFLDRMNAFINRPDTVRFLRMIISEAEHQPAFATLMNQSALSPVERVLRDYLKRQVARGELQQHDTEAWVKILIGLVSNLDYIRALLAVPDDARESRAESASRLIISLYVSTYTCA